MYKLYLLVLVSTSVYGFARAQICQMVDSCRCTYRDTHIDLSPMVNPYSIPKFKDQYDQFYNNRFSYNPCQSFTEGTCSNAAVCQLNGMGQYFTVGTQYSANFTTSNGYLIIDYRGNFGSLSSVQLICSNDQTDTLEVLGEGPTSIYKFKLYSKYCCPVPGGLIVPDSDATSMSVGLMLIVGFSTFSVSAFILALIFYLCVPTKSNVQYEQRNRRNSENNEYERIVPRGPWSSY